MTWRISLMVEVDVPSVPSPSGRGVGWSHVRPRIDAGNRKPTPAQRVEKLLSNLIDVVRTEWKTIRALNLGVKSGTGIVDELILQKLDQWVTELHMLCISKDEAAGALRKAAKQLGPNDLQQLQVLLDTSNHPELSDYIRLIVFNSTDPFVTQPVDLVDSASPPLGKRSPRAGRRSPAQQLQHTSSADEVGTAAQAGQGPRPSRQASIRFTGFLPEDHALTRTAYLIHNARLASSAQGATTQEDNQAESSSALDSARMLRDYPVTILMGPCNLRDALRGPVKQEQAPPMHGDIEAWWKDTVHTVHRDTLLNNVMISDPTPFRQHQTESPDSPSRSPGRHREPNSPIRLGPSSTASALSALPGPASPTRQTSLLASAKGGPKERGAAAAEKQPGAWPGASPSPSPAPAAKLGASPSVVGGAAALMSGATGPSPSPLGRSQAK